SWRFNELADRDGFIAVYPAGIERNWNDGRKIQNYRAMRENIDDVGFISSLMDWFQKKYPLDPRRIYVTGISNGAMMSCRLACELSGRIAATAPVAGSIPKDITGRCDPKNPVSMMFINGDEDPLVPFFGGAVHFWNKKLGEVVSVQEAAATWALKDGCP